jgi:hypothetical protein
MAERLLTRAVNAARNDVVRLAPLFCHTVRPVGPSTATSTRSSPFRSPVASDVAAVKADVIAAGMA